MGSVKLHARLLAVALLVLGIGSMAYQILIQKVPLTESETNLTDRSDFRFPLLVGSEALVSLGALVDPAQSMSGGAPSCSKEETVGLAAEETE